ncbi:MAG: transposase [Planctomycetota bacterium]
MMGRPLRFVPPGVSLVEITCRTVQGRFLLRPGKEANRRIRGVLGRALELHEGIELHAYVFLSNHYHLLLSTRSAQELAAFMGHLNGNLARELGRLHRWREKFWGRRYRDIPVSNEESQQIQRLDYLLAQASKEGLVASPREWPGVTCVPALLNRRPDVGIWHDRTSEYEAKRRREKIRPGQFHFEKILELAPLPCWQHLDANAYRALIQERVEVIEAQTRERHERAGTRPRGRRAILRERPHHRPIRATRSPAPRFHCATRAAREAMWTAYRLFVEAYREAVARFRAGERHVSFPDGAFLPPIPLQAPG